MKRRTYDGTTERRNDGGWNEGITLAQRVISKEQRVRSLEECVLMSEQRVGCFGEPVRSLEQQVRVLEERVGASGLRVWTRRQLVLTS